MASANVKRQCCEAPRLSSAHRCPHLDHHRANGGAQALESVCRFVRALRADGTSTDASGSKRKLPTRRCFACPPGRVGRRLHLCLHCVHIACRPAGGDSHLAIHFAATDHALALDLDLLEIWCSRCADYVYDDAYAAVVRLNLDDNAIEQAVEAQVRPDQALGSLPPQAKPVGMPRPLLGLRGMNNLGNTCFMNSVLQVLAHNPLMRSYFLSDHHNRQLCAHVRKKLERNGASDVVADPGLDADGMPLPMVCLGCEMDQVFSQLWSGKRSAWNPHQFLHSMWRTVGELAAYKQQDAHEFYIALFQQLHRHTRSLGGAVSSGGANGFGDMGVADDLFGLGEHLGDALSPTTPMAGDGEERCPCLMHQLCAGELCSDMLCATCGNTRTKVEPFTDISCDLLASEVTPGPEAEAGAPAAASADHATITAISDTLHACLERFTRPEQLGQDQRFYCEACSSFQPSVKQLSFRHLPYVLALHLKRFKAASGAVGPKGKTGPTVSAKVDSYVDFPLEGLDMSDYLTSNIERQRSRSNTPTPEVAGRQAGKESKGRSTRADAARLPASAQAAAEGESWIYDCFGVIVHHGTMNAGHYTNFVRHCGKWYNCDDAWVVAVTDEEVRQGKAYLLFYQRRGVAEDALRGVASLVPNALDGLDSHNLATAGAGGANLPGRNGNGNHGTASPSTEAAPRADGRQARTG
eukprot:CAMPEP_0185189282 /NCGR_PEP_ID=MMETSP1140-20130426/5939_1 /TAXON_ID=298111 /ORGANISM="Pavlova sp., Strain CCMP459" /LENGTH=694 /DNA_ID=CAMNT_0027755833 /DNA_START=92 /DNA_END=2176 /DNA_ORIENTATION=-